MTHFGFKELIFLNAHTAPQNLQIQGSVQFSRSVMSDSLQLHGSVALQAPLSMNSPGKNTGKGCHSLFQGIFLTQGWNLGLLCCRQIIYCLRVFSPILIFGQILLWVFL